MGFSSTSTSHTMTTIVVASLNPCSLMYFCWRIWDQQYLWLRWIHALLCIFVEEYEFSNICGFAETLLSYVYLLKNMRSAIFVASLDPCSLMYICWRIWDQQYSWLRWIHALLCIFVEAYEISNICGFAESMLSLMYVCWRIWDQQYLGLRWIHALLCIFVEEYEISSVVLERKLGSASLPALVKVVMSMQSTTAG